MRKIYAILALLVLMISSVGAVTIKPDTQYTRSIIEEWAELAQEDMPWYTKLAPFTQTWVGQELGCSEYPDYVGTFYGGVKLVDCQGSKSLINFYWVNPTNGYWVTISPYTMQPSDTDFERISPYTWQTSQSGDWRFECYNCQALEDPIPCVKDKCVTLNSYYECVNGYTGIVEHMCGSGEVCIDGECTVEECIEQWTCTQWSPAECPPSEVQTRTCSDLNNCGTTIFKPITQKSCNYVGEGCQYNNPPCSTDYKCENNVCIPVNGGCNPACETGYKCENDVCVPENEGCQYGNPVCDPVTQNCNEQTGECEDKPEGCWYLNPVCPVGQICVDNVCEPGNVCTPPLKDCGNGICKEVCSGGLNEPCGTTPGDPQCQEGLYCSSDGICLERSDDWSAIIIVSIITLFIIGGIVGLLIYMRKRK